MQIAAPFGAAISFISNVFAGENRVFALPVSGWRFANRFFESVAEIVYIVVSASPGNFGYGIGGAVKQVAGGLDAKSDGVFPYGAAKCPPKPAGQGGLVCAELSAHLGDREGVRQMLPEKGGRQTNERVFAGIRQGKSVSRQARCVQSQ